MFDIRSRRDFLRITAGGMASLAASDALATSPGTPEATSSPKGEISVRVTDKNRKYASAPPLHWSSIPAKSGDTITIDVEKRYQPVLGFGAAFTDAACFLFNQLTPSERGQLFV